MIEIIKYSSLSSAIKNQLNDIIHKEFGHITVVKETKWATPDWTIINYTNKEIVTFYNIVERVVSIDGKELKAAGINNVITPINHRGNGFSSMTLIETESFLFDKLNADLGLLLCADNLVPFYQRLGWYKVNCDVYFDQPTGKKIWSANTMLLYKSSNISPKKIDLNGLPW